MPREGTDVLGNRWDRGGRSDRLALVWRGLALLIAMGYGGLYGWDGLLRAMSIPAACVGVLLVLLLLNQDGLLYAPTPVPRYIKKPSSAPWRLDYEEVSLRTADGVKLSAWLVKAPPDADDTTTQPRPTVLYLHGNGAGIEERLPCVADLSRRCTCNVFMLEYRGYGTSGGTASEAGLMLDAKAALRYLYTRPDLDHARFFVFGRSLGGAVAIWLGSEFGHLVRGVVVENTFTNIEDMAIATFPPLGFVPSWILREAVASEWPSLARIGGVCVPMLLVSGRSDDMIPPEHMDQLWAAHVAGTASDDEATQEDKRQSKPGDDEAAGELKVLEGPGLSRMCLVKSGNHNDTWKVESESYCRMIAEFIGSCSGDHVIEVEQRSRTNRH